MAPPPKTICDLPAELLASVCGHLPKKKDLVSFARTCRQFSGTALSVLFQDLVITDQDTLIRFARLFYRNEDWRRFVKVISFLPRYHDYSGAEGFPVCSTLAPHRGHAPRPSPTARRDAVDFKPIARQWTYINANKWMEALCSTHCLDAYTAILLALLPWVSSIYLASPLIERLSRTGERQSPPVLQIQFEFTKLVLLRLADMSSQRAMALPARHTNVSRWKNSRLPRPRVIDRKEITSLTWTTESICSGYTTDALYVYERGQGEDVLKMASKFRQLQHLGIGNKGSVTIPANISSSSFQYLVSVEFSALRDETLLNSINCGMLPYMGYLKTFKVVLGHSVNTARPDGSNWGYAVIDGRRLSRELGNNCPNLLSLTLDVFKCLEPIEAPVIFPWIEWYQFRKLKLLHVHSAFLSIIAGPTHTLWDHVRTQCEFAADLPWSLEFLKISSPTSIFRGIGHDVWFPIRNCRVACQRPNEKLQEKLPDKSAMKFEQAMDEAQRSINGTLKKAREEKEESDRRPEMEEQKAYLELIEALSEEKKD